jgi:hypothetical protein
LDEESVIADTLLDGETDLTSGVIPVSILLFISNAHKINPRADPLGTGRFETAGVAIV